MAILFLTSMNTGVLFTVNYINKQEKNEIFIT